MKLNIGILKKVVMNTTFFVIISVMQLIVNKKQPEVGRMQPKIFI